MNILEIHNLRKCPARGTSLLLNGEDVTDAANKVEILPDRILLHRFEVPVRLDQDQSAIVSYTTEIDELKIH